MLAAGAAGEAARHYAALGVPPDAPREALRLAYRAAVLRLHPDKAAGGGGAAVSGAAADYYDVQCAWEVRPPLQLVCAGPRLPTVQRRAEVTGLLCGAGLEDRERARTLRPAARTVCPAAGACHCGAGAGNSPASLVLLIPSQTSATCCVQSHQRTYHS